MKLNQKDFLEVKKPPRPVTLTAKNLSKDISKLLPKGSNEAKVYAAILKSKMLSKGDHVSTKKRASDTPKFDLSPHVGNENIVKINKALEAGDAQQMLEIFFDTLNKAITKSLLNITGGLSIPKPKGKNVKRFAPTWVYDYFAKLAHAVYRFPYKIGSDRDYISDKRSQVRDDCIKALSQRKLKFSKKKASK